MAAPATVEDGGLEDFGAREGSHARDDSHAFDGSHACDGSNGTAKTIATSLSFIWRV